MRRKVAHQLVGLTVVGLGLLVIAGCTSDDDEPAVGLGAGSRDMAVAAEDYRSLLATGELADLESSTVLTVEAVSGGATVDDLIRQEQGCLDWTAAELVEIDSPVTPTNGTVTYTDGTNTVDRPFGLADEQFGSVAPNTWYVVLDDPPCGGAG